MTSIVGKIERLDQTLLAREVLQTSQWRTLAERDLSDANLPHSGQEEALIKVHYNVNYLGSSSWGVIATFGLVLGLVGRFDVVVDCN